MTSIPFQLSDLKEIFMEAGATAMRHFRQAVEVAVKQDGSLVTVADWDMNEFLRKTLQELLPSSS